MKSTAAALSALLCVFSIGYGGSSARAAQADPPETANSCVGFQNQVGDKQLVVHASNDCERKLSCTLDYKVLCEDHERKVTSRAQKRSPFKLGPKGEADLTLSAESCQQGWAIDELVWSCR